jgi:hypothetical protein
LKIKHAGRQLLQRCTALKEENLLFLLHLKRFSRHIPFTEETTQSHRLKDWLAQKPFAEALA